MSRLVSSSCQRVGDSCGEEPVLIGRAHTEWHNGTALSWYETEPAWKTRNDRISVYSVAPPEYCFVRKLSKPIFERRINGQRWNHGHYVILLCFCWSPESAWISPRFSALELIIEVLIPGFRFRMFDVEGLIHQHPSTCCLWHPILIALILLTLENFDFWNYLSWSSSLVHRYGWKGLKPLLGEGQ